jgi:hypothetical protein
MSATKALTHQANAYKPGDRVKVVARVEEANNWYDGWVPEMDAHIGETTVIVEESATSGYRCQFNNGRDYWFPSCALELVSTLTPSQGGSMSQNQTITVGIPATVTKVKPKRRRRVGPGPWDQAPCTHLRWNLMAFFRERLAVVKTKVQATLPDGSITEVEVAGIQVVCTKCKTSMNLQAK